MSLFVLALLAWLGAKAPRLTWQPFAWIAAATIPAVLLKIYTTVKARAEFGEDASALWSPEIIAQNGALQFVIWSVIYLLGHAVGRLSRWRTHRKSVEAHRP